MLPARQPAQPLPCPCVHPQQGVTRFVAKIGFANEASQALFAKLGYKAVKRSEVFKEVDMELGQSSEGWAAVAKAAAALQLAPYDEAG